METMELFSSIYKKYFKSVVLWKACFGSKCHVDMHDVLGRRNKSLTHLRKFCAIFDDTAQIKVILWKLMSVLGL